MPDFWDEVQPTSDGWSDGSSYVAPVTDSTVTSDVATASAATNNTGQNSAWTGFGDMLNKVVSYGLAKDAAQTQIALQAQQQQTLGVQPLVSGAASAVTGNTMGLLLVGALVLGVVMLANHKG